MDFATKYKSVVSFFAHNDLPPVDSDPDIAHDDAIDMMISICEHGKFQDFDIDHLISSLSDHYKVARTELDKAFDEYENRIHQYVMNYMHYTTR